MQAPARALAKEIEKLKWCYPWTVHVELKWLGLYTSPPSHHYIWMRELNHKECWVRSLVGGSTFRRAPISRSPLDKNPMPGHLSELHPVNEVNTKGQFFRASFGKKPQVPNTARQAASLPDNKVGSILCEKCAATYIFTCRDLQNCLKRNHTQSASEVENNVSRLRNYNFHWKLFCNFWILRISKNYFKN